MDRFESKALAGYHIKPLTWLRFIDDIFMIWTHGEEALVEFITYLNSLHPSIKFTHEYSHSSINFLDTTIKFNSERERITTLYNKPTDNSSVLTLQKCTSGKQPYQGTLQPISQIKAHLLP